MKLIEKLAEEARSKGVNLDPATAYEDGYLDGFRKAREMILDRLDEVGPMVAETMDIPRDLGEEQIKD